MKEIEILVPVISPDEVVRQKLSAFIHKSSSVVKDCYFRNDLFPDLDPDESGRLKGCLRIREAGNKTILTRKTDEFNSDGSWAFSNEVELLIPSSQDGFGFLFSLGFKKLVVINSRKEKYHVPPYEVVYETVDGLGRFLEVEFCTDEDVDVSEEKQKIRTFLENVGLSFGDELDQGKPELMLRSIKDCSLKK